MKENKGAIRGETSAEEKMVKSDTCAYTTRRDH
jgi:hypothetical protein